MPEKIWLRVPEPNELPPGATQYWGVECRVCNKHVRIGDASSANIDQVRAATRQTADGKMLWVICPHCHREDQLYAPDDVILIPAS